ncbi:secretion protein HlyD family protein [Hyphomicrobium denitrificans ATCC 51888]|uniref:Secretion protein HlyD family protein n=1 Tax=Hyphomicrobium denitrificans (strain ATCC 51888 / DSM 1869 / NCIMB 11706 / TK 0415) TaxID=582899 RepID=D8JQI0_HYPDA|nr:HlyD family secretion protein [Hyphomicrobium denitrificans]ADJ23934.1 secretion protein HlyD family protein [Hyphomicrobium denitrificans ATCC 51888]
MARGTLQTVLDHPSDENSHRQNQQSGSGRIHSLAKSSSAPEASEAGAMKADASPRADSGEPATARESGSTSPAASKDASKPASRKKPIFIGIGALALMAGLWAGYHYITVGRFIVSTDDAYVGVHMSMVSPKVSAYVADVPVADNQFVKGGDVLVRLDDGDYRLALDQAKSKLATQNAAIATFDAQIKAAEAAAAQARAQIDASKANVIKTEADFSRTNALTAKDYATKASLDAAIAARDSARAQVKANEAAIQSADANIALLHAQREQATQVAKELQVAVEQAARDLSFTVIRAPFDGIIGNKNVQVGDYVTPAKRLAAIIPLDKVYVDANLKETQLGPIVVGQEADVEVDALGGTVLKGKVVSVAPASGSQFSLLPPENATGNFTKIVQRVPVRIEVPASEAKGRLRPGLSVVVDIDTRTTPKTAEQQHASN